MNYEQIPTEHLIDALPENLTIYKDSGAWTIREDHAGEILLDQDIDESFRDFIIRFCCLIAENGDPLGFELDLALLLKDNPVKPSIEWISVESKTPIKFELVLLEVYVSTGDDRYKHYMTGKYIGGYLDAHLSKCWKLSEEIDHTIEVVRWAWPE